MGFIECLLLTVVNVAFCIAFPKVMYIVQTPRTKRAA